MKKIIAATTGAVWCFIPCLLALIIVATLLPGYQNQSGYGDGNGNRKENGNGSPSGPNISSCHPVWSEPPGWGHRHEINCCQVRPYSEQPVKEFEFPSPSSPLRIRRAAHLVDDAYAANYEKAVALMKQLHPDSPLSFSRQANIHCLYCNDAYYRTDSATARVPFAIHFSWLFFPFHRFYIYYHERILGKLIGDDTFALPFWNWDAPDGMPIPDIYTKGSLHDPYRDIRHLPPEVADVNYDLSESGLGPEDQIHANLALMYHQMISGATKPELFMGCKLRPDEYECSAGGTIENAPHSPLHFWVGSKTTPEMEDMGTFYAAARDPVFYAHHGNIDRLWEVWRKRNGYGKSEPEFPDPRWLDSYCYFYDEDLNLVRVKVRDAIDMDKLRYTYEEVELPWVDARPKPSVPTNVARDILRSGDRSSVLRMPTSKGPWTLDGSVRVLVARPKVSREKDEEEVLVVHGISVRDGAHAKFDVYINLVDETVASPRYREFAGTFVKIKGGMRMGRKSSMKLGISEILEDLEAGEDESIWVSLVPRGGSGNVTTVDRISIEYMK